MLNSEKFPRHSDDWYLNVPKGYPNDSKCRDSLINRVKNNKNKTKVDEWYRCFVQEIECLSESVYTFSLSNDMTIGRDVFLRVIDKNGGYVLINVHQITKIVQREYVFGLTCTDEHSAKVVEIMETDFSDSYREHTNLGFISTRTLLNDFKKPLWFKSMFSETVAQEVLFYGGKIDGEN